MRFRCTVVRSARSDGPWHVTGLKRQTGHRAVTPGPAHRRLAVAAIFPDLGVNRHCPVQVAYSEMHSDALPSADTNAQTASPPRCTPPSGQVSSPVKEAPLNNGPGEQLLEPGSRTATPLQPSWRPTQAQEAFSNAAPYQPARAARTARLAGRALARTRPAEMRRRTRSRKRHAAAFRQPHRASTRQLNGAGPSADAGRAQRTRTPHQA